MESYALYDRFCPRLLPIVPALGCVDRDQADDLGLELNLRERTDELLPFTPGGNGGKTYLPLVGYNDDNFSGTELFNPREDRVERMVRVASSDAVTSGDAYVVLLVMRGRFRYRMQPVLTGRPSDLTRKLHTRMNDGFTAFSKTNGEPFDSEGMILAERDEGFSVTRCSTNAVRSACCALVSREARFTDKGEFSCTIVRMRLIECGVRDSNPNLPPAISVRVIKTVKAVLKSPDDSVSLTAFDVRWRSLVQAALDGFKTDCHEIDPELEAERVWYLEQVAAAERDKVLNGTSFRTQIQTLDLLTALDRVEHAWQLEVAVQLLDRVSLPNDMLTPRGERIRRVLEEELQCKRDKRAQLLHMLERFVAVRDPTLRTV